MSATPFAQRLAEERQRAGWSQAHLALECGFDHSLVCRYEAGKRHPSRDSVERMCDVLELDTYHAGLLLVAAGFVPHGPEWLLVYRAGAPVVWTGLGEGHHLVSLPTREERADA